MVCVLADTHKIKVKQNIRKKNSRSKEQKHEAEPKHINKKFQVIGFTYNRKPHENGNKTLDNGYGSLIYKS